METVKELIDAFREDERDAVQPYFWTDAQLVRWVRQAADQFCEITRSVIDNTSPFTEISVGAGESNLPRHHSIIDIIDARTERRALDLVVPGQHQYTKQGSPCALEVGANSLTLQPAANAETTVRLTVIRRPAKKLELQSKLEDIPVSQRENLLLFLKHKAYRVNDAETFNPAKADNYLQEFERACQTYHETAQQGRRPGNIKFRF